MDKVEGFLRGALAELLNIAPEAVRDGVQFRDQGLDSPGVLRLVDKLSTWLGRPVPATSVWRYSTLRALAGHLAAARAEPVPDAPGAASAAPSDDEPIAIVGLGCRMPGGIASAEAMWEALRSGLDAVIEVPPDRWEIDAWFDAEVQAPGKMTTRWGGFLGDVASFDPGFFGISPAEARQMDPQQRLALETAWEAFEDARVVPTTLGGSRTGVFFGAMWQEYGRVAGDDAAAIEVHSAVGWDNSIIPARIAYHLGLNGPVMTINTACSSSLVAVHLAVQSLRRGETDLVLAGGVSLMLTPHATIEMTKLGAMSPAGRCHAFDARADGYVRGEGCGALVLRRLSDALAAGDRIYALLRGSAVNSDGASNGLTAPNPDAQAGVIRTAWQQAGVAPGEVAYVEAHGTGTALGDPIEAAGLSAVFAPGRVQPLCIGSAKTNFGHLEAAAGVTGLIKAALALHHGELPPSLHFETPNPHIDFEALKLQVVDRRRGWPSADRRFAGVSSFGFGGTNAHVALQEAPYRRQALLALAADSPEALGEAARRLGDELVGVETDGALYDLESRQQRAARSCAGPVRAVVRGRTAEELRAALQGLVEGSSKPSAIPDTKPRLVFFFSGHGGQWLGMGRDLMAGEPAFRASLEACDRAVRELAGWSVIDALTASEASSRLDRTDVIQPVLFSLQVALARTLQAWGVSPDLVLGQSVGEVAAAVVAGALSLRDGARVICRWSALIAEKASGRGAMVVADLSAAQAERLLAGGGTRVSVAAHLSRAQVCLAGPIDAVEALQRRLEDDGIKVLRVRIDYAAHSAEMEPLLPELMQRLAGIEPSVPAIPMWSTAADRLVDGAELDARYWARNLREPARIAEAIERLARQRSARIVEVGPHPIALHPIQATLASSSDGRSLALATCWREAPARDGLEALLGALWCDGFDVDWDAVCGRGMARAKPDHPLPLVVSGKTEEALRENAGRLAAHLEGRSELALADVAFSLATTRAHFEARAAVAAGSAEEAAEGLSALAEGRAHKAVVQGAAARGGKLAVLFTGQGSQRPGMGKGLYEAYPVFRQALDAVCEALDAHLDQPLRTVMFAEAGSELGALLEQTSWTQPALFALEVALFRQWQAWGVQPSALAGHSIGELSAAHVSGMLSLSDAARLVCARGRLMQACEPGGAMVSMEASEAEVAPALAEFAGRVDIAALNGPRQTVISGDAEAVLALSARFEVLGRRTRRLRVSHAFHSAHMDSMLAAFEEEAERCEFLAPQLRLVSHVDGAAADEATLRTPAYWVRQVRKAVRFADAMRSLQEHGVGSYLECGPDGVLAAMGAACLAEGAEGVFVASLRKDQEEARSLVTALGQLHVHGHALDWKQVLAGYPARRVDLPTYAFQRQRYWLDVPRVRSDVSAAGLRPAEHPLLGAATRLADGDGSLFTGRLSLGEQPWLRDHVVFEKVLFPGTGMLELALAAARAVGSRAVSELILAEPLVLGETGALRFQLSVDAPDAQGRRGFGLYSQPEEAPVDGPWIQHATGTLADEAPVDHEALAELRAWPVPGAEAVDLSGFYDRVGLLGLRYGPAFQGLVELSRRGSTFFGRVVLPEAVAGDAEAYGVHPALLDAALHTMVAAFAERSQADEVPLPFAWSDVALHATGASELRVRFQVQEESAQQVTGSLCVTDATGEPVASIVGLEARSATAEQLRGKTRVDARHLYQIAFQPVSLAEASSAGAAQVVLGASRGQAPLADALGVEAASGLDDVLARIERGETPARVVVDATSAGPSERGLAASVHEATGRALLLLQAWLSERRFESVELVWVTRDAIGADAEDGVQDLAHAPLWGLLRTARIEHPDRRLRSIDVGAGPLNGQLLARALDAVDEPELSLRGDSVRAARLLRAPAKVQGQAPARPLDPRGTVLVTGGTGELGQAVATHLVREHGARHLVLTSRRGLDAPGAHELLKRLEQLGAETVTIVACNVSDRAEVAGVLAGIAPEHPLTAVWHLAGVLDDGVLVAQTPERFSRVLGPKVDGALHLHELTQGLDLSAFVLFSSAVGTLGGAGQSNYAAANTFLDALAARRRRQGLSATSLAWGFWTPAGVGMTAHLGEAEVARMRRAGYVPMPVGEGLELLDAALSRPAANLVPSHFDLGRLQRSLSESGELPALLRALVRPGVRKAATATQRASALRERLSALPEPERLSSLIALARSEVAVVLGLPRAEAVLPDQVLRELGLDSLMAMELRNRLSAQAQTKLPATLAFDYPTPRAIAELLLKQAFSEVEAATPRARPQRRVRDDEPIAIVSMACRLPGGVESPEEYWRLLSEGRDAIEVFPSRWDALSVYDPDPEAVGKSYVREGGFLRNVDLFDAGFFGISPREAQSMDPQQRLVLETAWEALERAGVRPSEVSGSATGMYLGWMGSDYGALQGGSLDALDGYQMTGTLGSVTSGRVAYVLGLQGPTMTVDTACSSSLVALHLACAALRQGECDIALSGGVMVMTTPTTFVEFSRLKALPRDGRCKSFSAQADGAIWAEGCAMLVLKRLSDAQRDGDRVLAVVRGSAVNQDGRSQGLTAPNGPSQQRVIRQALSSCRLSPEDIDAVEAHGTGTSLGDPIEAGALAEVFGPGRAPERPVYLGSAKSNLGHAQAAAGVAGVIKMVLAMQHEELPKTLHAEEPSPHIAWEGSGLSLLQQARPWPRGGRVRRAGVSSFGISGTNAHVILEEAPAVEPKPAPAETGPLLASSALPLVLSGRDEAALRAQAERWARWLKERPGYRWADVVSAAALTRVHFEARAAVAAGSAEEAAEGLSALAEGRAHKAVVQGAAARGGKLAVLFTGQGSQRPGMGKDLYEAYPVFRQALDAVCEALDAHLDQPLRTVMFAEAGSELGALLEQTSWTQPALFALEVALFRQWQAWGVQASVLAGHSIGELSAAHVSGMLSLSDAARLVCARGRLMQACEPGGVMVSLEASEAEVAPALAEFAGRVDIAAINGPRQTVISGDAEAVLALSARFEVLGRRTRRLRVSHAFHSAHMDSMLAAFEEEAERCEFLAPRIPLVSHVDGAAADEATLRTPAYWVRQVRKAVRFADAMRSLQEHGVGSYLECGPDGVLAAISADCLPESADAVLVSSLRKDQEEARSLATALGQLHVHGHALDWKQVLAGYPARRVDLPTYAFQRQRYWLDAPKVRSDVSAAGLRPAEHPLLGAATRLADGDGSLFTGRLSLGEQPWLRDHVVFGKVLFPGAGILELSLEAARAVGSRAISELILAEPLVLADAGAHRLQLSVGAPDAQGRRGFGLYSQPEEAPVDGPWIQHATGVMSDEAPVDHEALAELRAWPVPGAEPVDLSGFYDRAEALGLRYGPAFQGLVELSRRGSTLYGRVVLPGAAAGDAEAYGVHPALLDAALHTIVAALAERAHGDEAPLPFAWSDVVLHAGGASELRVRLQLQDEGGQQITGSLCVTDATGEPVASIAGLEARRVTAEHLRGAARVDAQHLYRVEFRPVSLVEAASTGAAQVVLSMAEGQAPLAGALGVEAVSDLDEVLARVERGQAPARVVVDATAAGSARQGVAASVHEAARRALLILQAWLSERRFEPIELVWVTRDAIGADADDDVQDLAHAPLWGLLRTARSEHPDRRLRLIDAGAGALDGSLLARALDTEGEPELSLRGGRARAARLTRVPPGGQGGLAAPRLNPEGTVLITGGTGELGQAVATHLVRERGVRHLLLTSRRGLDAPGAPELVQKLKELGAEAVSVVACDISDRAEVAGVLAGIAAEHPLTAVLHLAGVLDDGVLVAQTPERFARVLRPKVDGALHLHELTQALDLAAFVLFSSASGTLGTAGQSNYAAANTFLDALAAHRLRRGLPAKSLAWGLWAQAGVGMTAHLGEAEVSRIRRAGFVPMSVREALLLLDAALARPEANLVPSHFDLGRLQRSQSDGGELPAMFRALVRPGVRKASSASHEASALRERLSALPEPERLSSLIALTRSEVAVVLGLPRAEAVLPDQVLRELGLDSLTAVELRNRLSAQAQTKLPATLAFDYPTPRAIAELLLKQAFSEVEAATPRARPQRRVRDDEPIAIVSMACRLPGGVESPEEYWRLLSEGRDAIEVFPSRWDALSVYDPDPEAVGKSYVREGGFLRNVDLFDAGFFGISPREAQSMDPQQRLVLETAWEALERAGVRPASLSESAAGVYLGAMGSDYGVLQSGDLEALDGYWGTGSAGSVISGRVAYVLGLQGPALTVDTACSSSLVTLHLACTALRQGECDIALSGGVMVMTTPATFVEFSRLKALPRDGRCKSFSARADGAIWAEGCAMLVLKRLSDAQRDGDRVLAVIRGSAVNQDGRSQGLTAPNGPSQQRVIRQALSSCRLTPEDIDAVEAHGTGTSLGDPIEAGALAEVFGPGRAPERPVYLGSAKSNLGHAQAAAGVAGVMKMVLAMQHEELPKTLHAEEPSPHVAWEGSGLSLLQQAHPWPRGGRVRRAGVSSFGISGTNAHVILEEAPAAEPKPAPAETGPLLASSALPLVLSGRDEAALRAQAERWARWLKERPGYRWADVVSAAALHRTHFEARAAVLAGSAEEAAEGLSALAEGRGHASVSVGKARAPGKVVFVFPGQGSQWLGMGRALLEQSAAFAEAVEACDAALKRWTGWSVAAILRGEQGEELPPFTRVDVVQPALFAMSVGLAAAWRSLGVEPAAVVGHSQGEVAAAVVAGALSLQDGARVVALRSQAVRKCAGKGGMVLVERPVSEVQGYIERFGEALSIAAVNTASSTVVSGDARAVDELVASLQAREVFCRKVNVDYASHSAHMDELLPELASQLASLEPRPSTIPFYSTVTGALLRDDEALDGEYWCRNLRLPVRLDKALVELLADGHGVFVEVSAHPILAMPLTTACAEAQGVVVGSLQRGEGGLSQLSGTLGALHVQGYEVDWKRLFGGQDARHVDLPTYAFQRQRYWLEASKARSDLSSAGLRTAEHPLLGAATRVADTDGYLFTGRLSLRERPWLRDHAVFGKVLFPGTGMLELALTAARAVGGGAVSELILAEPLVLSETEARRVQLSVEAPDAQGRRGFGLYSQPEEAPEDAPWVQHATGTLTNDAIEDADAFEELQTWPVPDAEEVDLSGFYERLEEQGVHYGPSFQGLIELSRRGSVFYGQVALPEAVADGAEDYGVHPTLLDAALQTLGAAIEPRSQSDAILMPFAWSEAVLLARGASALRVRFELREQGAQQVTGSLFLADAAGEPVASIHELKVRRATASQLREATRVGAQHHLYRVELQPVGLAEPPPSNVAQVVLRSSPGQSPLADALAAETVFDLDEVIARLDRGADSPVRVVVDATVVDPGDQGVVASTHEAMRRALLLLQAWLSDRRLESMELVWVTRGALGTDAADGVQDLVHAPLCGLLRTARSEYPDRRLRLIDVGSDALDPQLLARALATTAESELLLRSGAARAPRLVRAQPLEEQATARPLNPEGTVLVTGATGGLGHTVARHLVQKHGARHLVLTSRRGLEAPGAPELV
ncbi:SDR family NAD(P)-dependent oxidoreductase, partial [Sorangium sp. So ce1036]|uniref:SDR family NAD(P)-dependent oxidoreductase n=1 Tax=Sorangium sp. So ce1036 TaxID=3133328 RepID=UPI003F0187E7